MGYFKEDKVIESFNPVECTECHFNFLDTVMWVKLSGEDKRLVCMPCLEKLRRTYDIKEN